MDDIKRNSYILPSFIHPYGTKVDEITCKKVKRLQFNINLIDRLKKEVSSTKKFFAFDTEAYEHEQEKLTEFGWSTFNNNGKIYSECHYIVDEYYNLRNHDNVPDNKDNYLFGKSKRLPLREIEKILKEEIKKVDIGQGIHNDIKYLKDLGININEFRYIDGESFYSGGKAIIDTTDLYAGYYLDKPSSLENGLIKCNIPHEKMHNAGNDAHYTMKYVIYFINNMDITMEKYQRLLRLKVPSYIGPCKYYIIKLNILLI
ncbi:hypothetical protein H8356DRAFT_49127 [Neocallimastix lanati (nom. inval.)]|nr:hypothetical protein H8356DRAFT_49127 [Neocallimastix sp. JGI-2020a]